MLRIPAIPLGLPLFLASLFSLAGCAPRQEQPKPQATVRVDNSRVYQSSYDKVFNALLDTLDDYELPLQYVNRETGMIETEQTRAASKDYQVAVDGPSNRTIEWEGVEYASVRALVVPEKEGSSRVTLEVRVKELNTATGDMRDVTSTGRLEAAILERLERDV